MGSVYSFGRFTLDASTRSLVRDGQEVALRPKSFETLLYLIEHRSHVVPKRELLDAIWPEVHVVGSVVRQCLAEIRSVLEDDASRPQHIRTIPKQGYRWIAQVTRSPEPGDGDTPGSGPQAGPSIAVLPFKDMSQGQDLDYFCEGLAEEIINALAQSKSLQVTARTSAFFFKGREMDIREIGRKLNVETVLEGSLRKSGNLLRIGVQLIKVSDGFHLWSEQLECETGDVFDVQDQITRQVIKKLRIKLLGKDHVVRVQRGTEDSEAYVLNLKAQYLMRRETVEGLNQAIHYFEQAVGKDPDYAQAHAGLAECYSSLGFWNAVPPVEAYLKAKNAAVRAVESDPESALAHATLGFVSLISDWDWEVADRATRRAVELNPDSESTRCFRAVYFIATGDLETGLEETTKAKELAPLSNFSNSYLGLCLLRLEMLEEAVDQLKKTLELEPADPRTRLFLGQAYILNSKYAEGISEILQAFEQSDENTLVLAGLGWAYGMAGRRDEALEVLERLKHRFEKEHPRPYLIAKVYSGMDEKDQAFVWLERAFAERDTSLALVKTDESFATLREDPRFDELLRRMNLLNGQSTTPAAEK